MAEQNNLSESVDIIGRKNNAVVHYSAGGDKVINLSQSSVVKINASPESVSFYERQGDDLIVHMKDGSVVRYQHFFTLDSEGLHSELVFEDQTGVHHAVFPAAIEAGGATAAAAMIVPTFSDVSLGSLLEGGSSSMAALGGLASVLALGGIALAANSNSGSGSGGSSSSGNNGNGNGNGNGGNPGPVITVKPFAGDDILNFSEAQSGQNVSGTVAASLAGREIRVTLGGQTFTGHVNADGSWQIFLPSSLLASLADGAASFTVSITDRAGKETTVTHTFQVDSNVSGLPQIYANPIANDYNIDATESRQTLMLTGGTSHVEAGRTVTVILNGVKYYGQTDSQGNWRVEVPDSVMKSLVSGHYDITVSATDAAGNEASKHYDVMLKTSLPTLTVLPLTGDDTITSAEQQTSQLLKGTSANAEPGSKVMVTINGITYTGTVGSDGSWSILLPSAAMKALTPGQDTLVVTLTDAMGQTVTNNHTVTVNSGDSTAIAIISTDDYLNAAESAVPLEIRGTSVGYGVGVDITVMLNGKSYPATIDPAGNWSVLIPVIDLAQLLDGVQHVTATMTGGASGTVMDTRDMTVIIHNLPAPGLNTPFSDGILNANEAAQTQLLSGNTGVSGAGQSVRVQVGDKTYLATVNANGDWQVNVPSADLQNLPQGSNTIIVTATDAAGNQNTLQNTVTVDTLPPTLSVLPFTGDNILNATEMLTDQQLSGLASSADAGRPVTVTLNNIVYATTVGPDGKWSVTIPASDLQHLPAGSNTISVTVTDAAGNPSSAKDVISVKTTMPTLTVAPLTGDDVLNGAEVKLDQVLRGSSTNAELGSKIQVTIGGHTYTTTVGSDGSWQVVIPAADLAKLANGKNDLDVMLTDLTGQTVNVDHTVTVNTSTSGMAISIIAVDNYLNASEASQGITLQGASVGIASGTTVNVVLNGKTYTALIDANGHWQVNVSPQDLQALKDGTATVTATAVTTNGNVQDSRDFTVMIHTLPNASINVPFGDGVLNQEESQQNQVIQGSTGIIGGAQTVLITLNGSSWLASVDANGNWSATLPFGALDVLSNGSTPTLTVTVTDAAGNQSIKNITFTVDTQPPSIIINPFAQDDVLNATEAKVNQTLSGSVVGAEAGQPVVVTLDGNKYLTTVDANGHWQVTVPANDLQALRDGQNTLSVTIADRAGNSTTVTDTIDVHINPQNMPSLTINVVAGNNIVDAAEKQGILHITGTASHVEDGQFVTLMLDGVGAWTGIVIGGGWSVDLPANVASMLNDGSHTLTVSVSDKAGNSGQVSQTFTVDSAQSAISVDQVTGDDRVSASEITAGVTLTGTTANVAQGMSISVMLNGKTYLSTPVDSNGRWSLFITPADAADIADGTATLTYSATDKAGNLVSGEHSFTIITHNQPSVSVNTPFGDGTINANELQNGGVLTGSTGAIGSGQTVTVTINGAILTATVGPDGHWSVNVPGSVLQGLPDGALPLVITATDSVGNSSQITPSVNVHQAPLQLSIDAVTSDNIINIAESASPISITGTATPYDAQHSQNVVVTINGQSYTTQIQSDGTWKITLPAGALAGVADGPLSITVAATDYAGNSSTVKVSATLDASAANAPTIAINAISSDDYINAKEANQSLILTGTTTHVEAGRTVTVTFNGKTYSPEVQPDGSWSVPLTASEVSALADGQQTVHVAVTDVAGNSAVADRTVNVISHPVNLPGLTMNVIAGDDIINAQEHNQALTITGSSSNLPVNTVVTVMLNGKSYTGAVLSGGNWSITVPQGDVQALQNGQPYNVTASAQDAAKNDASAVHNITVDTQGPLLSVTLDGFLQDGVINLAESLVTQLLHGKAEAGATVSMVINGKTLTTTANGSGDWSFTLQPNDLQSLTQGKTTLKVTASDAAGNTSDQVINIDVGNAVSPVLAITSMYGDGIVSKAEAAAAGILSGTSSGLAVGTTVTVVINGKTVGSGIVGAGGIWTATVAANALAGLDNGQYTVTVSANDNWGNPANASNLLDVVVKGPTVTLPTNLFGTDNIVNQVEAAAGQILNGNTGVAGIGQTVTVLIDGVLKITGTVDASGNWSILLPPSILSVLADGGHSLKVTITDRAGNSADSGNVNFAAHVDGLPVPQLIPPFSDGVLNASEALAGGALTINTGINASLVGSVLVSINNGAAVGATLVNGVWMLNLDSGTLQLLNNGSIPVKIIVTDIYGNTASGNGSFTVQTTLPTVTIATPFGDGILNSLESGVSQTITGSTGLKGLGQSVLLTINGHTIDPKFTSVDANGNWTVTLSATDLLGIGQGTQTITVKATDAYGNSDSSSKTFTVHTSLPTPSIDSLFGGDGILNIDEAKQAITLSGKTGVIGGNQLVKVTIDVNGTPYTADVDANGNWSLTLPGGTLSGLSGSPHQLIITATDQYGNSTTINPSFNVAFSTPTVAITGTPFGDGMLNIAEAGTGLTLNGTFNSSYAKDSTIVISVGGKTFTVPAANINVVNGTWSYTFAPNELGGLTSGTGNLTVSITDGAHNTGSVSSSVTVALNAPTVTINGGLFGGDDKLSYAESLVAQTITGTTTGIEAGQQVTVHLNGKSFTTTVLGNGSWSVTLQPVDLLGLTTGQLTATVTDAAKNPATSPAISVDVNLTPSPSPSLALNSPGGDGYFNSSEMSGLNITFSGESANLPPNTLVTITITGPDLLPRIITGFTDPLGHWTSPLLTLGLPDGNYTITAEANGRTVTGSFVIDTTLPTVSMNPLTGDNVINASEASTNQLLSGTASLADVGQSVVITLGGHTYHAIVQPGGTWSVSIPSGDLQGLGQGSQIIELSLTDKAGNISPPYTQTITVDTSVPLLAIDALSLPAVLTTANGGFGLVLNGTGEPGSSFTLTIGPISWSGTVGLNGKWSYTFPKTELNKLTDGAQSISIHATDNAGNVYDNSVTLNVALNQKLGAVIDNVFGNNGLLNVAESLITQTLTGHLTGDYRGATVTLNILGIQIPVSVAGDGTFNVQLPPSLWAGLTDGPLLGVSLDVKDPNGNVVNESVDIKVALSSVPVLGSIVAAGDNIINAIDSQSDQLISGTINNVAQGATVVLKIGGQTITAITDASGHWTATLSKALLSALPDGLATINVSVTDTNGNGNTTSGSLNLTVLTHNLPAIQLNPLFGDGTLSLTELASGVISGTASGLAGRTISITLNGGNVLTAQVGSNGQWSANLTPDVTAYLQGLGTGTVSVALSATDSAGNEAKASASLGLDLLKPILNGITLFGDGLLNATEALLNQTISGTVGNAPIKSAITVAIGGKVFVGFTDGNGNFSISLKPGDLAGLADGTWTPVVTITTPGGNTATVNAPQVIVGINKVPSIVLNTLFGGDGYLNHAEAIADQTISGTVTNLTSGTVQLMVGGTLLTANIKGDGSWSANVPASLLSALSDGNFSVTATVTDAAGNVASSTKLIDAIVNKLPSLSVNTIFGDGVLSLSDLLSAQLISGSSTNLAAGTVINITLGPLSYTTTVGANGSWQVSLPVLDLKTLLDGNFTVSVSAKDAAGNPASASGGLSVGIHLLPTLTLDPLFGDNGLNINEAKSGQTISGTSTNAIGGQVTITLNGKNYTTVVGSNGSWSVQVSQADLSALAEGATTVTAKVSNLADTVNSLTQTLNVINHTLPTVTLGSLFGNDGFLNVSEASNGQLLTGTVTSALPGATVQVTLGTLVVNAVVTGNTWSLNLTSAQLNALGNGPLSVGVKVIDAVGNTNSTSNTNVTVKLTTPILTLNALATLNLVTLLTQGLTLSGSSQFLGGGAHVSISLAGKTLGADAITNPDGTWSAKFSLGLDILTQLLSLQILDISATDFAGNTGTLHVGLDGKPIVSQASMQVESADTHTMSLLAASESANDSNTTTPNSSSSTSSSANNATDGSDSHSNTNTDTTATLNSFTIGGVSIDLADGTSHSGDSAQGASGNDTIHLSSLGFSHIDGGMGIDTLVLDGVNINLNLIQQGSTIQNIEIFDLGKSGTNSITLNLNEAITVKDTPQDDLLIKGVNGDQVNLVHGQGDLWAVSGQREVNGVSYDVYHNSSQGNTLGDVLIQQGVHVNLI